MDWATIKPALQALVASLTGLEVDKSVVWRDKRRPFVGPAGKLVVLLSIGATASLGIDDRRYTYDDTAPNGEQIEFTEGGLRRFTFSIRCQSYDHTDGRTAHQIVEQVRDRIRRRSSLAALNAVECALIRREASTELPTEYDQHLVSDAQLDLILAAAVTEADPAKDTWIETFGYTGTYS